jgi:hypothetical protein
MAVYKVNYRLQLLAVDSFINLSIGAALLILPKATISFFGLPITDTTFYVTVLGAVLFGIGIALWIDRRNDNHWRGLGLFGAAVINILGGGTVFVWLLIDPFNMPFRGYLVLWVVAIIVVGTALIELLAMAHRRTN